MQKKDGKQEHHKRDRGSLLSFALSHYPSGQSALLSPGTGQVPPDSVIDSGLKGPDLIELNRHVI